MKFNVTHSLRLNALAHLFIDRRHQLHHPFFSLCSAWNNNNTHFELHGTIGTRVRSLKWTRIYNSNSKVQLYKAKMDRERERISERKTSTFVPRCIVRTNHRYTSRPSILYFINFHCKYESLASKQNRFAQLSMKRTHYINIHLACIVHYNTYDTIYDGWCSGSLFVADQQIAGIPSQQNMDWFN